MFTFVGVPAFEHVAKVLAPHPIGARREFAAFLRWRHEHDRAIRRARFAADQFGVFKGRQLTTHRTHIHLGDSRQGGYGHFVDGAERTHHGDGLLR